MLHNMKQVLDYGLWEHIVEVCTNNTLVAIYKLHVDQLHFPYTTAHFVKNFTMWKPTGKEAQAVGASLAALSLQRCQISCWTDIVLNI